MLAVASDLDDSCVASESHLEAKKALRTSDNHDECTQTHHLASSEFVTEKESTGSAHETTEFILLSGTLAGYSASNAPLTIDVYVAWMIDACSSAADWLPG